MKTKNSLEVILFIIYYAILLSLIFIDCKKEDHQIIRLGYGPFNSALTLMVAQEKGYFYKHGITVELVFYPSTDEMIQDMVTGKIDGLQGIGFHKALQIETRTPNLFKMFNALIETDSVFSTAILIRKDSPIHDFSDLKGKRVGTFKDDTQLKIFRIILNNLIGPQDSSKIIQVDKALEVQALTNNQIEALFTIEPGVMSALSTDKCKVLVANPRGKYIINPFPAGAHCISCAFIEKSPKLVTRLVSAIDEASDFIKDNPHEAKKIAFKYIPMRPEDIIKTGSYEYYTYKKTLNTLQDITLLTDIYYKSGIIPKNINIDNVMLKLKE